MAPDESDRIATLIAQRDALAQIVQRILDLHEAGNEPWISEWLQWRKTLRESQRDGKQ